MGHISFRVQLIIHASYGMLIKIEGDMIGVVNKFFTASMLMWIAPIAVLYGFNQNLFHSNLHFTT
ncbi:hypothetical protein ACS0TY_022108 [Phlomoides rotata]